MTVGKKSTERTTQRFELWWSCFPFSKEKSVITAHIIIDGNIYLQGTSDHKSLNRCTNTIKSLHFPEKVPHDDVNSIVAFITF